MMKIEKLDTKGLQISKPGLYTEQRNECNLWFQ